MRASILVMLALAAACSGSNLGQCSVDSDCPATTKCEANQHVCAVPPGVCFPACSSAQSCNTGTLACDPAGQPDVVLSAPGAGAIAGSATLTAVAVAHAPGGISKLVFEVRSGAGALLASTQGTAASGNPASFSASIPLSPVPDGAANVVAVASYGTNQSASSAPVSVLVDQHPPVIALQSDGRTTTLVAGQAATVTAQISDGAGTGVQASSVALKLANHADVPGVAAGGVYTFTVPIDDSVAPAGTTTTVSFQIVASDGAGHAATLNGNPAGVIRVDRDKPQITAIAITTTPDFAPGDGRKFFDAPGTSIKVQANIADGAGLDEATVCLRVAGEAGACPHLGSNHGAGSIYFFDMPRPAGTFDGTEIDFTISADDALAAVAETSKAEHQGTSPGQPVFFDNTPPVVVVTADTNVYARNGGPIDVTATITDGTGLSGTPSLSGATASAPATTTDNVHFVFHLSALSAPALTEGDFNFQIAAHDLLGHQTLAPATRRIDGAAPTISNLKIFRGDVVPTAPGVTFPAAVPNTGWNGSTFIYSDTVHVQGTLTDLSGIGSAVVHLDGLNLTGGNSTGTAQSLGCAPAATSCNFGVDITLNAAGSTFHTGTNTVNIGVTVGDIPSGILQFVIDAQDTATSFVGTAAPNLGTQKTP
ncbi:MAG TPA: hypothetical protein VFE90_03280, partial [Myxococcales bacterium]|nr:hypothetical protein [Myxococcales bacterium]